MEGTLIEWLNLLVRWAHVFSGVLWIGSTYYFSWLDGRVRDLAENPDGIVWMVHSGGFYRVEKFKAPGQMPPTLHWFKWEAALTWLTGMALLPIVYHLGGNLAGPSGQALGLGTAFAITLALLVSAWIVYDLLWMSALGDNGLVGGVICYLLTVAAAYGLSRVFAGRTAYIHVGAMFGTLMAANVWLRILPAQRKMIAATIAGRAPDLTLGERAKQRSKHNTFMVVPVVFIMISNHFPTATYGTDHAWLVLSALILVGFGAAKVLYKH